MRIFDAHSDIFLDVKRRRLKGETDVFRNHHIERLNKGNVSGIIMVIWTDIESSDRTQDMLLNLGAMSEELRCMEDIAEVVYRYEDMERLRKEGKLPVILGMEGLSGIKGNVNAIDMLYRMGVRHASLTWNEENYFGTGISNPEKGLTELGVQLVRRMEELNLIIDVSHANEKTFWDIHDNTKRPFIASHSNAYNLRQVPRNLKDDQIKAIAKRGGVIGMNAWRGFTDAENPNLEKFANHIDYISNLVGTDHIGLGFDFCGFLDNDPPGVEGLEDASKTGNLIEVLIKRGYSKTDIEKIAYGNFERIVKEILG